ncbi:hypothetical protein HAZT_HAZT003534, partial [Hyalella azteca]
MTGQTLVRVVDGERLSGRVTEVESYLGGDDEASHSHHGKRTPRNEPMYMQPGTAYVYAIYGSYHCFNISSRGAGSAVLIRALEPLEGEERMRDLRDAKRSSAKRNSSPGKRTTRLKTHQICNGPSKLCIALSINKDECNKLDLCSSPILFLEEGTHVSDSEVVTCKRVGIDRVAQPWRDAPLRYYVRGSCCVSVRDRLTENISGDADQTNGV